MESKYTFITIFLIALAVGGGIYFLSAKNAAAPTQSLQTLGAEDTIEPSSQPVATDSANTTNNMEELKIEDEVIGTGAEATPGKNITVNYSGTLVDGTKFDSSYDRGTPFSFVLGAGRVIQGWEQGFNGMKVGGKRKLTIPASLGYGSADMGVIPPNSTLIFEVELLGVQ